ncbi:response regulator [Pseudobacteriovorax antillogorgiicola]|uniref:Response regulator receiver domain-containing protein n=1 Tax=Pseudobacteriovorax antillogorgiicola TaxID=1513793 RepID=A0A1Y6BDD7_9BACT|nr:response regulator [Pseudobacteriovorax antillogorgiicola]TCS56436.1 response regulator receiver domain-containing protein [Pseudobacteriovorax antillogorgiicola]SMF05506.1 Response regulator receiver domain-containing protein [Pseudobacteriovorax antillogorgiicola]
MQLKALIIDDNPEIVDLVREVLAANNFSVTPALSAEEGLLRLKHGKIQVVISDIRMPEMDGFEFVAEVRRLGYALPIIGLTGLSDLGKDIFESQDGKQRAWPDQMLAKPFTYDEFYQAFESISDRIDYASA